MLDSEAAPAAANPAGGSLDVPKAGALLEVTSGASALNPTVSQDVAQEEPATTVAANPGDVPLDGDLSAGIADDADGSTGPDALVKKKKSEPRILIPFTSEELNEIIKQGFTVLEKECQKTDYDNGRLELWKTMLEDYIVKGASFLDKPFKFTFYVSIHQNTGDAMHLSLGAFFQANFDGYTTGHWENDDIQVDVVIMAFSVQ
ncbi:hypothetical protein BV898_13510 [Hypsibius exemplaris]|uniref:Uncharacterized protein n=1 Tax=Hypsibius exemplaris TaxID=2072580 RepID=A0A1W0WAN9_HYPEX|nr:hypothetical protein BV898_13510 [Hypsibius exemplaris]